MFYKYSLQALNRYLFSGLSECMLLHSGYEYVCYLCFTTVLQLQISADIVGFNRLRISRLAYVDLTFRHSESVRINLATRSGCHWGFWQKIETKFTEIKRI